MQSRFTLHLVTFPIFFLLSQLGTAKHSEEIRLDQDAHGRRGAGILRLHQIYGLKLDADMVVVSACETALGKDIRGEGLAGLTQGFLYAGASRVTVSLWSVNDQATADLMRKFYSGILLKHLAPPAALRVAQIEMWKQKRSQLPFYWAPFVIQGEWRQQSP